MTQQDFEDGLDRWGSDLTRWPPSAAEKARQILAVEPLARQALAASAAVDTYLLDLEQQTVPAYLERQIVARVPRQEKRPTSAPQDAAEGARRADVEPVASLLDWLTTRLWRPALMAVIPMLAGFLIGIGSIGPTDGDVAADMAMLVFSDLYAEVDDAQQ